MKEKAFSVRRRAVRPFLVALAGVPLMAVMYDFLTGSKLLTRFGEIIYRNDLDAFEPRDLVWASLFAAAGTMALVWGLRELLFPRRILGIDEAGLSLAVGGPFRSGTKVPWANIDALRAGELVIDEETIPTLDLTVLERGLLPEDPWTARWRDEHTLSIDTVGWDRSASEVLAVFDAQRRARVVLSSVPASTLLGSETLASLDSATAELSEQNEAPAALPLLEMRAAEEVPPASDSDQTPS